MRISYLKLENFKNLKLFELRDIPQLIVLAGPNGVGKSSVLEAISFAKELIAPYTPGTSVSELVTRIRSKIVSSGEDFAEITINFELANEEIEYLKNLGYGNAKQEYECVIRSDKGGGDSHPEFLDLVTLLKTFNRKERPEIGIVDFIDAHRIFRPQTLNYIQINLNEESAVQRRFSPGEEKYNNFKQLLLRLQLFDLQDISQQIKTGNIKDISLQKSHLSEIRRIFELLAPKEFQDVDFSTIPIKFNVKIPSGVIDIDDLSSGEKEILFVFADLYNLRLNNSIVLFDEPDLHLNEKIQYRLIPILQDLGKNNQIWITTHSAGLINSVETDNLFRISDYSGSNQIVKVVDDNSKIDLIYDVVGSNSVLTLGEKIVFIEGNERTDKAILDRWFNDMKSNILFVSANSVNNVNKLTEATLSLLHNSTKYTYFYCIRDRDFLSEEELKEERAKNEKIFIWSKYHIENFLINKKAIFNVSKKLLHDNQFENSEDILIKMKELVKGKKDEYVNKMIDYELHKQFRISDYISIRDTDSHAKIENRILDFQSSLRQLSQKEIELHDLLREKELFLEKILEDGNWINLLPGKSILQHFHNMYMKNQIKFESFKNLIVEEIKQIGIPSEINDIICKIQNS